ncbi:hypothetical protein D3C78_1607910 [compost metagenome]
MAVDEHACEAAAHVCHFNLGSFDHSGHYFLSKIIPRRFCTQQSRLYAGGGAAGARFGHLVRGYRQIAGAGEKHSGAALSVLANRYV